MVVNKLFITNNMKVGINIAFKYDPKLVETIKIFKYRYFNSSDKTWDIYIPLMNGEYKDEIEKFDKYIKPLITEEVYSKVINYINKSKSDIETKQKISKVISKEELKDIGSVEIIDIPHPSNLSYYPFQEAGILLINYFLKNSRGVLIADDMGLGKTITSIGYINLKEDIKNVVVVCPSSVISVWVEKLPLWLVRKYDVYVNSNYKGDGIYVYSYTMFTKMYEEVGFSNVDLLIIDEAHYIKNQKSKRANAVVDFASKCKKILALSGTPFENRPFEIYNILNLIQPNKWEFWSFVKRYCNAYRSEWGWDFTGASNVDELNIKLRK